MAFVSLLLAFFIFLIGALAPYTHWTLGSFNPLYWGLAFFSFSFLAPNIVTFRNGRF